MGRTAKAILSTANLMHNLKTIKDFVLTYSSQNLSIPPKIIAMVKANAYGHGLRSVSKRLDGHVDMLGVASIDEALALRAVGVKSSIMLAEGVFEQSEFLQSAAEGFHIVFHSMHQLKWFLKVRLPCRINAWVKIDTGLSRLGFAEDEARDVYNTLLQHDAVNKPIRIMSHFACADDPMHSMNNKQIAAFSNIISDLRTEYSICNSGGIFYFPSQHYHFVRPGIALYGIHPTTNHLASELGLKPVMTLQTSVIAIQRIKAKQSIGYGATYVCANDSVIAIVAFGYGDGYPISSKPDAIVMISGHLCNIVGRISMDMMAVDITKCAAEVEIGSDVILWGDGLPLEIVANHTLTSTWSMITSVQNRVKFLWTHDNA